VALQKLPSLRVTENSAQEQAPPAMSHQMNALIPDFEREDWLKQVLENYFA
jgi:hypothetical protein